MLLIRSVEVWILADRPKTHFSPLPQEKARREGEIIFYGENQNLLRASRADSR